MQIEVLNIEGKATGKNVDLPDEIFGAEPNDHLIYLAVKQYRAAQHLGNAKVKGRGEVKGSTRKLHRQKGTGGSRKGNIRNPLYKGGGTVHGPNPHKYAFKMNKKEKDFARVSALSYKAKEESIYVLENPNMEEPKTKTIVNLLSNLELTGKRVLFVQAEGDDNFYLSSRNIQKVDTTVLSDTNTYDILNASALIFTEDAAKIFTKSEEAEPAA